LSATSIGDRSRSNGEQHSAEVAACRSLFACGLLVCAPVSAQAGRCGASAADGGGGHAHSLSPEGPVPEVYCLRLVGARLTAHVRVFVVALVAAQRSAAGSLGALGAAVPRRLARIRSTFSTHVAAFSSP
jgi:hypothetical protein